MPAARVAYIFVLVAVLIGSMPLVTRAAAPATDAFERTWARTDKPVADGVVARTWMWGPEAFTGALTEPYAEAPGGERTVQYFDKSRMEDAGYRASGPPWDVTNGLLARELITGRMQVGDDEFEQRSPAMVNVAGDGDDPTGPQYASFGDLLDADPLALGATIIQRVDRQGNVSDDQSLASRNVTVGFVDAVTNHAIAAPFWDFMNSSGTVYEDGQFINGKLFENAYFATGRPITEAYWAEVKVAGTYRDVLMQCFERRCLTYTPDNQPGWQVEAGNVGRHYYSWRYGDPGDPGEQPPAGEEPMEPEMPEPATKYEFVEEWGALYASESPFNDPTGVAVAPNGNIYVVDLNDRVQVFDANGFWIKSWGQEGDGPGEFNDPHGIAVDGNGNVYVADFANDRVQKFDPDGAFLDEWAVSGSPADVAIDRSEGVVYVVAMGDHTVRSYTLEGINLGSTGEYGGGDGQLFVPNAVAVGPGGAIYVADTGNNRVQIFKRFDELLGIFGSKGAEPGQFQSPNGIAVAANGDVYVSDAGNGRIQRFSLIPEVAPATSRSLSAYRYQFASEIGSRGSEDGQFRRPDGLALNGDGRLYIADLRNDRIQKFGSGAAPVLGGMSHIDTWYDGSRGRFQTVVGMTTGPDGLLNVVDLHLRQLKFFTTDGEYAGQRRDLAGWDIDFDSQGNAYFSNNETHRVEKYGPDGELLDSWGPEDPAELAEFRPQELAIDASDNVYVINPFIGRVYKFGPDGAMLTSWGTRGAAPGQFDLASDIAVYGDFVYVVDSGTDRVQQFDLDGTFIREWGGTGSDLHPIKIAIDEDGYLYVTDRDSAKGIARIQKFTPDGEYLTTLGRQGDREGEFKTLGSIAVDGEGNVFAMDHDRGKVLKFAPVS